MNRAIAIAFYAWTTANRRAAADYAAHPSSSCHATRCDQLADGIYCPTHRAEADAGNARRRAKRRAA